MATAHRVNSRALKSILALYMYAVYKSSHPFLMDYLLKKIYAGARPRWGCPLSIAGLPCSAIRHITRMCDAKLFHYVFEISSGLTCFRCMRKRAARLKRNKDDSCYPRSKCCCCWASFVFGCIVLFSLSTATFDANFFSWLLVKLATNYLMFEPIETFVSNAIGVARTSWLLADGPRAGGLAGEAGRIRHPGGLGC
jgi:hypothetical protein